MDKFTSFRCNACDSFTQVQMRGAHIADYLAMLMLKLAPACEKTVVFLPESLEVLKQGDVANCCIMEELRGAI